MMTLLLIVLAICGLHMPAVFMVDHWRLVLARGRELVLVRSW